METRISSLGGGAPGGPEQAVRLRFPREERLKSRKDIREVFNRGRRASCGGAKLFALQNGLAYNRIGITFSRKFGNAVERNRARRTCREAYRHLRHGLKAGFDLVALVYPGKAAFSARMEQFSLLFSRLGLLGKG